MQAMTHEALPAAVQNRLSAAASSFKVVAVQGWALEYHLSGTRQSRNILQRIPIHSA
jgi:hypothetical protein